MMVERGHASSLWHLSSYRTSSSSISFDQVFPVIFLPRTYPLSLLHLLTPLYLGYGAVLSSDIEFYQTTSTY